MIFLIFGQPASGKTTLAEKLNEGLSEGVKTVLIDGDRWREVSDNFDYSREGRIANLKSAFNMAIYLNMYDFVPILSFVCPYEELRQYLRSKAETIEIYLTYNEDRGRNMRFATDFEEPTSNCLRINTSELSIEESYETIKNYIKQKYE